MIGEMHFYMTINAATCSQVEYFKSVKKRGQRPVDIPKEIISSLKGRYWLRA